MGFLPNGDLILVSLDCDRKIYKIYLYCFKNRLTTDKTPSQVYDIEIPKSLNPKDFINCFVYQTKETTKLFLSITTEFHEHDSVTMITQWDLLKMTDLLK